MQSPSRVHEHTHRERRVCADTSHNSTRTQLLLAHADRQEWPKKHSKQNKERVNHRARRAGRGGGGGGHEPPMALARSLMCRRAQRIKKNEKGSGCGDGDGSVRMTEYAHAHGIIIKNTHGRQADREAHTHAEDRSRSMRTHTQQPITHTHAHTPRQGDEKKEERLTRVHVRA